MIEDKYIRLINKEIDGEITAEEKNDLQVYLHRNPQLQNHYQDFIQSSNLLNEVSQVDPPANLKKRILNSVDFNRYAVKSKELPFKSFSSNLLFKPKVKIAYAFILGVLFTAIVFFTQKISLLHKQDIDINDIYGTIGFSDNSNFKIINNIPINLTGIHGSIIFKQFEQILVTKIDLNSMKEFKISLEYDMEQLHFSDFKPITPTETVFDFGNHYLNLSSTGNFQSVIYFTKQTSEITSLQLTLLHSGNQILNQKIIIQPDSE